MEKPKKKVKTKKIIKKLFNSANKLCNRFVLKEYLRCPGSDIPKMQFCKYLIENKRK